MYISLGGDHTRPACRIRQYIGLDRGKSEHFLHSDAHRPRLRQRLQDCIITAPPYTQPTDLWTWDVRLSAFLCFLCCLLLNSGWRISDLMHAAQQAHTLLNQRSLAPQAKLEP